MNLKHTFYWQYFSSILFKKNIKINDGPENVIENEIKLDIDWSDINSGVDKSKNDSSISMSLKRHGYFGTSTESMIILENGATYIPQELSDHWQLFNGSLKSRPILITYTYLSGIE